MMLQLKCVLDIGRFNEANQNAFDFVTDVEIESTWETMTDVCKIVIPKRLKIKNSKGEQTDVITNSNDSNYLWKRTDPVNIRLGYRYFDGSDYVTTINSIFQGYITKIVPVRPITFECQDAMLWLKLNTVSNYSKKGTSTLDVIIDEIITPDIRQKYGDFKLRVEAIQVVNFKLEGSPNIAEVLDYFRKSPYNLSVYFQNNVLNVGFAYKLGRFNVAEPVATFDTNSNIINNNLDFMRDDDISVKVVVNNYIKNTKSNSKTFGDKDGELRTLNVFGASAKDMEDIAQEYLKKFKYKGYRGSFTTFLLPRVQHGDTVKMVDTSIPDGNGVYLVKKVITKFGMRGATQEIFLDAKVG